MTHSKIASGVFLFTCASEGAFNSRIVDGEWLVKAVCDATLGEDAPADQVKLVVDSMEMEDNWVVSDKGEWCVWNEDYEDGHVNVQRITDDFFPGLVKLLKEWQKREVNSELSHQDRHPDDPIRKINRQRSEVYHLVCNELRELVLKTTGANNGR